MGVKDFLGPPKTITTTLVFDQKELYNYLKKCFGKRGYDIDESEYTEKILADGRKLYAFVWKIDKRVDDYTKCIFMLEYKAEAENVQIELHDGKKKTAQSGSVNIKINPLLEKDIESEWTLNKQKAYQTLIREIYDKMVVKGKWSRYQSQLSSDLNAILSDIKTYLKTHRYD